MVGFMKSALNLFGIKKEGEGVAADLDGFLSGLPEFLGYDIQFDKSSRDDGSIHYELTGTEVDSFVGNSSEVLDALSHLAMRVQRKTEGLANEPVGDDNKPSFRVTFDADGFRERKTQELRELASEKRQRVLESGGKPAYISALSPSDRKVIHTHLVELGDVVSESIGKGNFKRIRIRLKDESQKTYEPKPQGENGNRRGRNNRRRGGQGGGRSRNYNGQSRSAHGNQEEVNGNRISSVNEEEPILDENIGNRLSPGEKSLFDYGNTPYGSSDN